MPNSIHLWKASAWPSTGTSEPSTHSGHVGHPSPDPVTRTSPPVTTMPIWATRLAMKIPRTPEVTGEGAAVGLVRTGLSEASTGQA